MVHIVYHLLPNFLINKDDYIEKRTKKIELEFEIIKGSKKKEESKL